MCSMLNQIQLNPTVFQKLLFNSKTLGPKIDYFIVVRKYNMNKYDIKTLKFNENINTKNIIPTQPNSVIIKIQLTRHDLTGTKSNRPDHIR